MKRNHSKEYLLHSFNHSSFIEPLITKSKRPLPIESSTFNKKRNRHKMIPCSRCFKLIRSDNIPSHLKRCKGLQSINLANIAASPIKDDSDSISNPSIEDDKENYPTLNGNVDPPEFKEEGGKLLLQDPKTGEWESFPLFEMPEYEEKCSQLERDSSTTPPNLNKHDQDTQSTERQIKFQHISIIRKLTKAISELSMSDNPSSLINATKYTNNPIVGSEYAEIPAQSTRTDKTVESHNSLSNIKEKMRLKGKRIIKG
jgi:hypothetical protein